MIGFRVYKLYRPDRLTVHLSGLLWLAFQMVSRLWLPKVHEIDIQHLLTNRSLQVVAKISTEVNKSGGSQFRTFLCPRLCRTGSGLNQEWIRNKWVIKRFLLLSIREAAKATEWDHLLIQPCQNPTIWQDRENLWQLSGECAYNGNMLYAVPQAEVEPSNGEWWKE